MDFNDILKKIDKNLISLVKINIKTYQLYGYQFVDETSGYRDDFLYISSLYNFNINVEILPKNLILIGDIDDESWMEYRRVGFPTFDFT